MTRIAALVVAALVVAGCGVVPGQGNATPGPISLRTAASPVPESPCAGTTVEGTLVESAASGLGLLLASAPGPTAVTWPYGWTAGPSIGGSNLMDPTGNTVARTGDIVRIEASALGGGSWLVCGQVVRVSFDEAT
jgi:hypothetical protein